MAINVNRSITDPFYRYKMPRLLVKHVGKGNGVKTIIVNMSDIAKSLKRPVPYPIKYFGYELGAQTKVDVKNERYIVNGEHEAGKLQDLLDVFICKFVLCPTCDNPETILTVRRDRINSVCKACGHAFVIDPKQKMCKFIIKNAPQNEYDFSDGNEKKLSVLTDGNEQAIVDRIIHRNDLPSSAEIDDDVWASEPLQNELFASNIGKLFISKELEKSAEERLDILHHFFMKNKVASDIGDGNKFIHEAERLKLKHKAPLLLVHVLFDQNIIAENQIEEYQNLLRRFTLRDQNAQRYLLGGFEQLIVKHADLFSKADLVIKILYEARIVGGETLITWGEKPCSKYVSRSEAKKIIEKCAPVIDWVRKIEKSGGSVDAAELDDTVGSIFEVKKRTNEGKKVVGYDGHEIDIDDI